MERATDAMLIAGSSVNSENDEPEESLNILGSPIDKAATDKVAEGSASP